MKDCPHRATPVVALGCATEAYAANAKAKATACSSTDSRSQSDRKSRGGGRPIGRPSNHGLLFATRRDTNKRQAAWPLNVPLDPLACPRRYAAPNRQ
jgi:hypothetical protein